jgi:hypothetical protein
LAINEILLLMPKHNPSKYYFPGVAPWEFHPQTFLCDSMLISLATRSCRFLPFFPRVFQGVQNEGGSRFRFREKYFRKGFFVLVVGVFSSSACFCADL